MERGLTIANLIDRAAARYGDGVFVYRDEPARYAFLGPDQDGVSVKFNQALEATQVIARALQDKLGVRRGDRIAIVLTNQPEITLICQAAARIGAITVPFNYMLKATELTYAINDCQARVLVTEPRLFEMNIHEKGNIPGIEHWIMAGPAGQVAEGFISLDSLTEGVESGLDPVDLDPDETIAIFYTAGTTGRPKGAMLSSENLLSSLTTTVKLLGLGPEHLGVTALPMAHIFGFNTIIMGGLYSGSTSFVMRFFDPEKALQAIEKYRATTFLGVPAMYNLLLLAHPEKYDLSSIRYWISGADSMPVELIKVFEALGGHFVEGYGLVETSPIVSVNMPLPLRRKPGSLGKPVPGVKVRILGEDDLALGRGKVGEIVVRGPNVMKGYWNDEEGTRAALRDGWLHTGDLGYKDSQGFLYFVDREKDVIKVSGYAVFPREVEEEMLKNPKIRKVAVVGVPHPTKREIPVAVVQLEGGETATEEELLAWCRERIAAFKAPRMIKIIDEMPLTMTEKVLKRELRSQLESEGAFPGAKALE